MYGDNIPHSVCINKFYDNEFGGVDVRQILRI